ncbi:hypothetical protein GTP45_26660 [Pseudoduganella sp. FT55W]|uniref:Uncharacterized protein n=1 Tax=Duganella rivi TaxID=2666083 RepID=A0A7X4KEK2_9BURK|nr:hypothetical protein [Duganella rivi]MYM70360.1 hypothetical protein [Duganella rivi]
MTNVNDRPPQPRIVINIDEWESMLVRHFFAVGPSGDASDIRTLEVSPLTLALACGTDAISPEQAENAFRSALLRDQCYLWSALKRGSSRFPSKDVPNCFAPLAMTLLIDSLLDGDGYENNQFRAKLASWLGVDRNFNDLAGVKLMWEELADWLDEQASEGRSFRRLVLPEHPMNWVHIGYTRRLSFPNRADVRAVERALQSTPQQDLANPTAVINAFWNCPHRIHMSTGLTDAFKDFEQAYYSQRRALADHRFWILINKVRAAASPKVTPYAQLEIALNLDDEREFRVVEGVDGPRLYQTLGGALADQSIRTSASLGASVSRGVLFFTQMGMGRWIAEPAFTNCRGRVLVAFHDKTAARIAHCLGKVVRYDDWRLSVDPVNVGQLAAEFASCGLGLNDVGLFRPAASDGVRVNGTWLGLPGFLPLIASDTPNLRIIADSGVEGLRLTMADGFRLAAERPVTGSCVIEPKPAASERGPHWRLKLQFVDRAAPHYDLAGARRRQPLLTDWSAGNGERAAYAVPKAIAWGRADDALEWLLEAIYASGGSGWDECDLVDLLRCADAETAAAPWRTLKMLQDGGVIEPRLRQGWKGKVWTLAAPRIVSLDSATGPLALAEGAFCAQLQEAFAVAAKGMGAMPFRLPGAARWSVPVMGAVGADPEKLARVLQWECLADPDAPLNVPLALTITERQAEHYLAAAVWCWRSQRFVKAGANQGTVRLTLLAHPAGTDHDVYRVEAKGTRTHFLSRCAAIVAAYAIAAVPLFVFDGQRLISMGRDGTLPDAICAALRRRRIENGGFTDNEYAYPATAEDARWIAGLLPRCVAGLHAGTELVPGVALSRARRSNGALRSQWIDGLLIL